MWGYVTSNMVCYLLLTSQRSVSPLKVMMDIEVPLWIALILKEQDKCNLIPPPWLNWSNLNRVYKEEVHNKYRFSQLPWNWQEVALTFLRFAPDDIDEPISRLFSILQDLKEIRKVKAQRGLKELNESNIQLNGLSSMEIGELKPFVVQVMDELRLLHGASNEAILQENSDEEVEARD